MWKESRTLDFSSLLPNTSITYEREIFSVFGIVRDDRRHMYEVIIYWFNGRYILQLITWPRLEFVFPDLSVFCATKDPVNIGKSVEPLNMLFSSRLVNRGRGFRIQWGESFYGDRERDARNLPFQVASRFESPTSN
jgi:hypothetical protein